MPFDMCYMQQLKCFVPDEILTAEIKQYFYCTRTYLPYMDNSQAVQRDKFTLKQNESDVAEFDLVDQRNNSKLKIITKQVLVLKVSN